MSSTASKLNGKITIYYIKFSLEDPSTDISRKEYYNRKENYNKEIILTNGSNNDPNLSGGGTQGALRRLNLGLTANSKISEIGYYGDTITRGSLDGYRCSIVFRNLQNLGLEQKFDFSNITNNKKILNIKPSDPLYFGSILYAKSIVGATDFRMHIEGAYHILGLNVNLTNPITEKKSIGIVMTYYTALLYDFATNHRKQEILHIAQIPGFNYGGTAITIYAMRLAIDIFCKHWTGRQFQINVDLTKDISEGEKNTPLYHLKNSLYDTKKVNEEDYNTARILVEAYEANKTESPNVLESLEKEFSQYQNLFSTKPPAPPPLQKSIPIKSPQLQKPSQQPSQQVAKPQSSQEVAKTQPQQPSQQVAKPQSSQEVAKPQSSQEVAKPQQQFMKFKLNMELFQQPSQQVAKQQPQQPSQQVAKQQPQQPSQQVEEPQPSQQVSKPQQQIMKFNFNMGLFQKQLQPLTKPQKSVQQVAKTQPQQSSQQVEESQTLQRVAKTQPFITFRFNTALLQRPSQQVAKQQPLQPLQPLTTTNQSLEDIFRTQNTSEREQKALYQDIIKTSKLRPNAKPFISNTGTIIDKIKGLPNTGNTCFANGFIQVIMDIFLDKKDENYDKLVNYCKESSSCHLCKYLRFFNTIYNNNNPIKNNEINDLTRDVFTEMKRKDLSHEELETFKEILFDLFNKTKHGELFTQLFDCIIEGNSKRDIFILSYGTIHSSVQAYITSDLDDNYLQKAVIAPEYLLFHLAPFNNNFNSTSYVDGMEFQIDKQIGFLIGKDTNYKTLLIYRLAYILKYTGNGRLGHFISYIYKNNKWIKADDSTISNSDYNDAVSDNATYLIYKCITSYNEKSPDLQYDKNAKRILSKLGYMTIESQEEHGYERYIVPTKQNPFQLEEFEDEDEYSI